MSPRRRGRAGSRRPSRPPALRLAHCRLGRPAEAHWGAGPVQSGFRTGSREGHTCSRNDFALARSLATVTIQLLTMSNPPVPSADIPELPCKAEDVDDFLSQPDERVF